jgi:hypothetical protein
MGEMLLDALDLESPPHESDLYDVKIMHILGMALDLESPPHQWDLYDVKSMHMVRWVLQ